MQRTKILNQPAPQVGWLVITAGTRVGRDFRLGQVTDIGRDGTKSDIILNDDAVSAEHARIKFERNQFVLYDLASSNGTKVNGKQTQRQSLVDGDSIVIGDTTLTFKEVKNK